MIDRKISELQELLVPAPTDLLPIVDVSVDGFETKHITVASLVAGAIGAPANAEYVTLALDAGLSDERVLVGTANQIVVTDGGAGGNVTLSTPQDIAVGSSPTFAGLTINGNITVTGTVDGVDIAALDTTVTNLIAPQYVTLAVDATLTNERVLTGTANQITVTDGGAGGAVTLSLPQDIDTSADVTFDSIILDDLTALRLVASDVGEKLVSTDLFAWVAGTANRVTVADDADGTITLSGPQDIAAASSPVFAGLTINGNITVTGTVDGVDVAALDTTVTNLIAPQYVTLALDATLTNERVLTGTANQIIITDNGAGGTVVLSTPQDLHTAATPTFGGLTLEGIQIIDVTSIEALLVRKNADGGDVFIVDTTNSRFGFNVTPTSLFHIGGSGSETDIINISYTSNTGGAILGMRFGLTASGDADEIIAIVSNPATAAAVITVPLIYNFYSSNPVKGAGSSIGTVYGMYFENMTSGGTNYAIYTNQGLLSLGDDITFRQTSTIATSAGDLEIDSAGIITIKNAGTQRISLIGAVITTSSALFKVIASAINTFGARVEGGSTVNSSAGAGELRIGRDDAFCGIVAYSWSAGVTYISNTYNHDTGHIVFRTKWGTGDIDVVTMTGAGVTQVEQFLKIKEQAAATALTASYGQVWVKTAAPNQLWFTDDAGNDVVGIYLGAIAMTGASIISTTAGNLQLNPFVDIDIAKVTDYTWAMGNSTKDPTIDAPVDWVQVEIAGTARYLAAYAA